MFHGLDHREVSEARAANARDMQMKATNMVVRLGQDRKGILG